MVYLLHFDSPYFHARHYLGWTSLPIETRLDHHRTGHGARLLQVITEAGINFTFRKEPDPCHTEYPPTSPGDGSS